MRPLPGTVPEMSAPKLLFCCHLLVGLQAAARRLSCRTTDTTDFSNSVVRTIAVALDVPIGIHGSSRLGPVGAELCEC